MTTAVLERPRRRARVKLEQPSTPEIKHPEVEHQEIEYQELEYPELEYPETDGKPMAESGPHARTTVYLFGAFNNLIHAIRKDPSIYLAVNMFLYYQQGNIHASKSPDLMLIKGVDGTYERGSFKIWVERAVPAVIIEVSSKSTWIEDLVNKAALYARLGVKEYFIFDPLHEYLPVQFVGLRLENEGYVEVAAGEDGGIDSQEMEARLIPNGRFLFVTDLRTGKDVPALEREHEAVATLEGELQQAMQRAEQEAQRAEQEALHAAEVEAENQRLRALLQEMQRKDA